MHNDGKLLSIVVPMFNEENTIGIVIERLLSVLRKLDLEYEIIVVDDHSKDNSVNKTVRYKVKVFKCLSCSSPYWKTKLILLSDLGFQHQRQQQVEEIKQEIGYLTF